MRLDALGFAEVHDYVPGKVDWLAHNLPVEGERSDPPTAGRVMRNDVVRCGPGDRVADVLEAIERSSYSFALVTDEAGMLLGRVRVGGAGGVEGLAGEVMELDPSTVRPHRSAGGLAQHLAERELDWSIVTTPQGLLLGVAWREDLETAAGQNG